VLVQGTWTPF